MDSNCVGWFKACELGSFIDQDGALTLAKCYPIGGISLSVLFLYDPHRTRSGHLSLKALRLKNQFVQDYTNQKKVHTRHSKRSRKERDFRGDTNRYEECKCSQGVLVGFRKMQGTELDTDFDRFDLSTNPFLKRDGSF